MFSLSRLPRPGGFAPLLVATLLVGLLAGGCARPARKNVNAISKDDREVLAQYELIRAALTDDDLRRSRLAGEKLLKALELPGITPALAKAKPSAKMLAETFRIDTARSAFKDLSAALIPLCDGVEGFYVVTTALVPDGVWVQTTREIGNPYLGRAMPAYGEIKK